jgi:hypothetical protein
MVQQGGSSETDEDVNVEADSPRRKSSRANTSSNKGRIFYITLVLLLGIFRRVPPPGGTLVPFCLLGGALPLFFYFFYW